ncbi:hypothetical protein [Mucilaginibacter xinganensis]|uniref:Uncharacterized protein n=1 Tax=Mucilaginibacter xinganensis TaxID=1234841 RepID=A0A223NWX8_9SPHI|nr:hypothetical protein [Mucilaginibacter xinganensis]ASU34365.1 hypothetical protein MuYL_2478 [Mucilaginibacter xinganensis]
MKTHGNTYVFCHQSIQSPVHVFHRTLGILIGYVGNANLGHYLINQKGNRKQINRLVCGGHMIVDYKFLRS